MLSKDYHKKPQNLLEAALQKSPAASRSPYDNRALDENLNDIEKFSKYGPSNFTPRAGQKSVLDAYWEGCRKFSLCGHRRWGKDTISWILMIISAVVDPGHYYYIMARKDSAKSLIIEGMDAKGVRRIDYLPKELVDKIDEKDGIIHFKNGSIIYFISEKGAQERLVGQGPKGIVFSDYSLHKQKNLYGYIEPALKESGGWVLFNFTPRGEHQHRHAWDQHKRLELLDDWFTLTLSIIDTGLVTEDEIAKIRAEGTLEEYQIQTEFYMRLAVDTKGSYYRLQTEKVKSEGRLCDVPYDMNHFVHCAFDLGKSDMTSIVFFQVINNFIHFIDLYENNEQTFDYYIMHLRSMKYAGNYGGMFLPHDASRGGLVVDKTVMDVCRAHKFDVVRLPKANVLEHDINRVKRKFQFVKFDRFGGDQLLTNLEQYKRKPLTQTEGFTNDPVKSVVNHSCDAFRYAMRAWEDGYVTTETNRIRDERMDNHFNFGKAMGGDRNRLDSTFRNLGM